MGTALHGPARRMRSASALSPGPPLSAAFLPELPLVVRGGPYECGRWGGLLELGPLEGPPHLWPGYPGD